MQFRRLLAIAAAVQQVAGTGLNLEDDAGAVRFGSSQDVQLGRTAPNELTLTGNMKISGKGCFCLVRRGGLRRD